MTFGFAAVCTLLVVITGRLVQLQGVDHHNYSGAASAQRVFTVDLHALRGKVLDRNGTPLAYTTDAQDITADPAQILATDRATYALKLTDLLNMPVIAIMHKLANPGQYSLVARAIPPVVAAQVEKLGLRGIYTQATTQRQYPAGSTAANVIGFVHSDGTGGAGIESEYNDILAGTDGSMTYAIDGNGNVNPNGPNTSKSPVNGGTVQLTVDRDLQFTVQNYLDTAVRVSGAKSGEVAVLTTSGQVLALASSKTFDPSNPDTISATDSLNPPVQTVFEPGSANKVVTFAAALQKHKITPATRIHVPEEIDMGGITVHDAWWHPEQTFTAAGVLAESSNVGTLKIAQRVGPQNFYDYEKAFGIGQATGIELPAESPGILPKIQDWSAASFANLPIGQGEAMTVLQLAGMYQTVANDGVRIPPRIVESVSGPQGTNTTEQPKGVRVISPQTNRTLMTMLEQVTTDQNGTTGKKAAIAGYRIAGKTGTAQQVDPKTGRYSDSAYWDTFAGIAPADKPQFVVAIMVDNPAHGLEGGDVAAPLFHEIATYELQHAGIPPTGSQTKLLQLQVP